MSWLGDKLNPYTELPQRTCWRKGYIHGKTGLPDDPPYGDHRDVVWSEGWACGAGKQSRSAKSMVEIASMYLNKHRDFYRALADMDTQSRESDEE